MVKCQSLTQFLVDYISHVAQLAWLLIILLPGYSKIILFLLLLVADLSMCTLHQPVDRNFFLYSETSSFVWIVCVSIRLLNSHGLCSSQFTWPHISSISGSNTWPHISSISRSNTWPHISSISRLNDQPFFKINLAWLNLVDSICFLYLLFVKLLLKLLFCYLFDSIFTLMSQLHCCFCLYYYYYYRVFHISVSWWFFTGVWVTASRLKSPGLVSVFWPSSAMLSFG